MALRAAVAALLVVAGGCTSSTTTPLGPTPGPTRENTDPLCSNGLDDDLDGLVDCDDPDCLYTPGVTVCQGREDSFILCHDGLDNDHDGLMDCADPRCAAFGCAENTDDLCTDGVDNDGDLFIDCDDYDCQNGCAVTVCLTPGAPPPERTSELCADGLDNDGNGLVDCQDPGCRTCVAACSSGPPETTTALCADGIDNDQNGRTDCADPSCTGIGDCTEATASRCQDEVDNDGNGLVDCADPGCAEFCGETGLDPAHVDALCADGIDNDNNGRTDCADSACVTGCAVTVCPGLEKSPAECTDGVDNDLDGRVDCDDQGCKTCLAACNHDTGENTVGLCANGVDDDGDGAIDCRDTECAALVGMPSCDVDPVHCCNSHSENTPVACADGIDNDNDPWIDCADRDCRGVTPCVEDTNARCSDQLDNDGDGLADCRDTDCATNPSVTVCATLTPEDTDLTCADGVDNDNDGKIDCADLGCAHNPALTVCPTPLATTLKAIRNPSDPGHAALTLPTLGTQVRVLVKCVTVSTPVVTFEGDRHAFSVQQAFPPADTRWQGIEVYTGLTVPKVQVGDRVDLLGFYGETYGQAQILFGSLSPATTEDCTGYPAALVEPTPVLTQVLATVELARPFAGVLVSLGAVRVMATALQPGADSRQGTADFAVVEASAQASLIPLLVSSRSLLAAPAEGSELGFLTGTVIYSSGRYRLAPRVAADLGPARADLTDADDDGLDNAHELVLGTNPSAVDSDGDVKRDLAEVMEPVLPRDTDCDGKIDAVESLVSDLDGDGLFDELDRDDANGPLADPDHDGQLNNVDPNDDNDDYCDPGIAITMTGVCTRLSDNCPSTANDTQADRDHDGLGDLCDPDLDGDHVCNPGVCAIVAGQCDSLVDNCPTTPNPDQKDNDADGQGDLCDPDDDNDGICDPGQVAPGVCSSPGGTSDDCPLTYNPGQEDDDHDGKGDSCDADDDNDGVCDPGVAQGIQGCAYVRAAPDDCPTVFNPTQVETRGNGRGDACASLSAPHPLAGELVLNEVLADPPVGASGDANRDGYTDHAQDAFVEITNVSGKTVDLADCTLTVTGTLRHRWDSRLDPAASFLPNRTGIVVFGGGAPVGTFGGAKLFGASTGSLGLATSGATVSLDCPGTTSAVQVDYVTYGAFGGPSGAEHQSLTRSRDGASGAALVLHTSVAPGVAFSPGVCASGGLFPDCL